MEFAIGGFAAVGAGFFTNPLEVIKTRMQLQGELATRGKYVVHYKNFLHCGYVIAKHDGILALQAGLVPALWFQLVLNGFRLGAYDIMAARGFLTNKEGQLVFYKSVAVSAIVGVIGSVLGSPFYLVKTHIQAQSADEIAFGHQHNHKGMNQAFKNIYAEQGVKGLFRGWSSQVPRLAVGSSAQLTSFDLSKQWLRQYELTENGSLLQIFTASMIGGVMLTLLMAPFDLIATRLYNQGTDFQGKGLFYDDYTDCIMKVWKSEGFMGFYKGLGPSYLKLGPHTVLSLLFWEKLRILYAKLERRN